MNFMDLLFALFSYMFTACQIEKEIGTLRMAYRFMVLGGICLLTFTIICAVAGINTACAGLWPMMFCDLVFVCMKDPEQIRNLCCLPISFKAKYYPPVILLLFMLLAGPRLGMIFGLVIGYMEAFKLLDRIILGLNTATIWEQKATCTRFAGMAGFVKA
jgi:hypothetical protein